MHGRVAYGSTSTSHHLAIVRMIRNRNIDQLQNMSMIWDSVYSFRRLQLNFLEPYYFRGCKSVKRIHLTADFSVLIERTSVRPFYFIFFILLSRLLSSPTRRRLYPQLSSGQAVVTGVVPSPRRYVPSLFSRIGFSIPTARRFSSNVANSRSRAFR